MGRPKNNKEFRESLAEAFLNVLEEKGLRWKQEWPSLGRQRNGVTDKEYRGVNAFNLGLIAMVKKYPDPRWVTMVQIMDKDKKYHPKESWHLKKGSTATWVEYWFPYDTVSAKVITWPEREKLIKNKERVPEDFSFRARYFAVYNASMVEGMPQIDKSLYVSENPDIFQDELINKLSEKMNVPIFNDGGDRAYYSLLSDDIHLPKPGLFSSEYAYNAIALHELAHATGHPDRLNRRQNAFSKSTGQYAYEELVAEMCSCFSAVNLKSEITPEHLENHKAYVQSWLSDIKEKPETLSCAIRDAQRAAVYMDAKAGLIPEKEFEKLEASEIEIKEKIKVKEGRER